MEPKRDYSLSIFDVPEEDQELIGTMLKLINRTLGEKYITHYTSQQSLEQIKVESFVKET